MMQVLTAFALLLIAMPPAGAADVGQLRPQQVVEAAIADLAETVTARRGELEQDYLAREAVIDRLLLPLFDLRSSCRLMLGRHWETSSIEQQNRFVDNFYRFLVASYGNSLTSFRKDTLTLMPLHDTPAGASSLVRAELNLGNHRRYQVTFYMRQDGRDWKIVDVLVEGVSYVRTYRSDFGPEIRANGLEAVIARLGEVAARER